MVVIAPCGTTSSRSDLENMGQNVYDSRSGVLYYFMVQNSFYRE